MKTTERFDNAVSKLYTAYHNGTLNPFSCQACAVGNILDNDDTWGDNGCIAERTFTKKQKQLAKYSRKELNTIEALFMSGDRDFWDGYGTIRHPGQKGTKETQFKGLCAVVEYLCELDNIPNVMDYTKLFESENNEPKYQLS